MAASLSVPVAEALEAYLELRNFALHGAIGQVQGDVRQRRVLGACLLGRRLIVELGEADEHTPVQASLDHYVDQVETIPLDFGYRKAQDYAVSRLDVLMFTALFEHTGMVRFFLLAASAGSEAAKRSDEYEAYRREFPKWRMKRLAD